MNIDIDCKYVCENELISAVRGSERSYVISFNIQSLNSKFVEFQSFVNSLLLKNCAPDIICLQEIWQVYAPELYNLAGYHPPVLRCRNGGVQGGGGRCLCKIEFNF
jgi:hypothetical protein